ncbi:hypothetical protein GSI_12370 [Ganoderma sinense ZZ0214-1]|uniref:Uncharacterized protein n=1 Tax=Ganoderma sinense ZZ0214-1 TaxID=1077348 RepID=A0A2G8RVM6_9APHY|nr:hypothetical protein GSI_12370 [Ganoderma sinense ZZ0214-1]
MLLNEKDSSAGGSYIQTGGPYDAPPSYDPTSPGPSRVDTLKHPPIPAPFSPTPGPALFPTFAPSPDGTKGPELPGDNPHGFMGHVKNFAPGKSPQALLDPPPASFLRPPAPGLPYAAFPAMLLLSKGATLDRGFPYAAPASLGGEARGAEVGGHAHPFAGHDVNEQDWRRFLHDVRVAGSLSPMNRVVAGLAPLALGIGIIFGFFIVKGVDSVMRRTKKGPVSQLIDYWNHSFFHPRCIHIGLTQGPPKDARGKRDKAQAADKNWRLIISYRPYAPA